MLGADEKLEASVEGEVAGGGMANALVRWMALSAAATSTRIESKQCGWLQRISVCTIT